MSEYDAQAPQPIVLHPIGVIRSDFTQPAHRRDMHELSQEERVAAIRERHAKIKEMVSELHLAPEYEPLLYGIEAYSHIQVLFWPHLLDPERRRTQRVHPLGRPDFPEQGVFATCTPTRPNPLLVSTVSLLSRTGATLRVQGLDAWDGSPILDIKPFSSAITRVKNPTVPEWMKSIRREIYGDEPEQE